MPLKNNLFFMLLFLVPLQFAFAQEKKITGKLSDLLGLPLPGVTITEKNSPNTTATDFDGTYVIKVKENAVLVFSYLGMKTQEIEATTSVINVQLKEDSGLMLNEIVVTALGIKRKPKNLGYSISTIKNTDITENAEPDLLRSLNGKVAGVNINTSTGVAGAANQIVIRGVNTFTGDTQPLIIVDGTRYSNISLATSNASNSGGGYESAISSLDPNNIASVSILKSVAASALYGSRAVNGVIIITTKTGSSNKKNKLSVTASSGTFTDNIANLPDYQNKYGAGANFKYSQAANGSWGPAFGKSGSDYGLNDDGSVNTWPTILEVMPSLGATIPYVAKPNNVKDLFETGIIADNSIGLNYQGNDGNFNTTISSLKQNGYIPNNVYNRTSIASGGNFKISDKITFGSNFSFSKTEQNGAFFGDESSTSESTSSSFARTLFLARNWDFNLPYENPITKASVTPNGNQFDHPLWSWNHDKIITNTNRMVAGISLEYQFSKAISANYRFGYNKYDLDRKEIRDKNSLAYGGDGYIVTDTYNSADIESTFMLNFKYAIGKNIGFTGILGNNILQTTYYRNALAGRGIILPDIFNLKNVRNIASLLEDNVKYRNVGIFADITLSYKEYLFLNATGRNDFSSSLPINNNTYFYPSASASFILTEALQNKSKLINFAKIRASFAKAAKDAKPEFLATTFLVNDAYNGNPAIGNPNYLANQKIKPEFTKEYEIGTELEFFNKRIALDASWYFKKTTNLITDISVPYSVGYLTYKTNIGEMNNKGIELSLYLMPIKTNNFSWTLTTLFTKNRNKVVKIADGIERTAISTANDGVKNEVGLEQVGYIIKGQPYGVFYGTKFARDANGNYLIDPNSGGILANSEAGIIGDPNADFKMSFTNSFTYKNFTLKTQFDWKQGGDFKSSTIEQLLGRGVTKDTQDREKTVIIPGFYGTRDGELLLDANGNPIANTTQITVNDLYFSPSTNGNTFGINSVNEATIYDGTVYRLREMSLTYDFPKKFLRNSFIQSLQCSFFGSNLWYFAPNVPKYTNFDPEVTSFGSGKLQGIEIAAAPTSKRFGFKINMSF